MKKNILSQIVMMLIAIGLTGCASNSNFSPFGSHSSAPPQHIAILLPQSGSYSASGQSVRQGFLTAYYSNLAKTNKQTVKFYDTAQSQNITALYQQAVADGANVVIGPLIKENVQQLSQSGSFSVPVLALNYTEPKYGSLPRNFYEFGLLPEDEINQMADHAHTAGLGQAIIIAPLNPWGQRMATAFSKQWQSLGGTVIDSWHYTPQADFSQSVALLLKVDPAADKKLMKENNNRIVLEQQRRHDFDVIFLFSQPQEARIIVPLLHYYYASNVPVYASSSVYPGKATIARNADLKGIIICNAQNAQSADRLSGVGQDAYLLSQTLYRLGQANTPIEGATGTLTLSSKRQIHRQLPCVAVNAQPATV